MKFLNLTLSLFLCIALASCSEDDLGIDTGENGGTQVTNGSNSDGNSNDNTNTGDSNQNPDNNDSDDSTDQNTNPDDSTTNGSDVISTEISETTIVGDWEIIEYETTTVSTTSVQGFNLVVEISGYATDLNNAKYHFSSSKNLTGSGEMTILANTKSQGVTLSSSTFTLDMSIGQGTWSVSNGVLDIVSEDNNLMIDENGNTSASNIIWEKNELKSMDFDGVNLTLVNYAKGTSNNNGAITTNEVTGIMVLKKIQ